LTAREDSGHYYLHYHEMQVGNNTKIVSKERIDKRVNRFIDFLKQNEIEPALIDICRSRYSGYTPGEQWAYIEHRLLEGLSRLFALELLDINSLSF